MTPLPWHLREPGLHVPYWLAPRDLAIERRHVELMRKVERERKADAATEGRK